MNKIFAICGKPGSGKSYVTEKIAKYYKSVVFNLDKMMLKLFGAIEGRELFLQKIDACKDIIYEISKSILENTKGNIIFDFGFWTKTDRKDLKERFKEYNVIFVYIDTPDDIRWERIEKRNENNNIDNYIFDKETFDFLSGLFEDFSENEEYIVFKNIKQLITEINSNSGISVAAGQTYKD
jgi:dephospho-CoA kinase